MSAAVNDESTVIKKEFPKQNKAEGGSLRMLLVGIVVMGVLALLAFQTLGCSSCY